MAGEKNFSHFVLSNTNTSRKETADSEPGKLQTRKPTTRLISFWFTINDKLYYRFKELSKCRCWAGITNLSWPILHLRFMQPSMVNLNSPSSRVVKDSTPFRRRILRCKNFGNGESSPSLFLDVVNLYLTKFTKRWILHERAFYSFIYLKVNLDLKINASAWRIFTQLYFRDGESWPNCFGKEVNWWWILTLRFCWKGEQRRRLEVGRFKMPFDACIKRKPKPNLSKRYDVFKVKNTSVKGNYEIVIGAKFAPLLFEQDTDVNTIQQHIR